MSVTTRAPLVLAVGLLTVFALGLFAGFVYGHEPAAVVTALHLEAAAQTPADEIRGTVLGVGPDFLEVSTTDGIRRVSITGGTPIEELIATREVPAGAKANVGGNRTESGFVLTGVVHLGER